MHERRVGPFPVPDLMIAAFLLAAGSFLTHRAADWPPAVHHAQTAQDIWFDADMRRVYRAETDRTAVNDRTLFHPAQRLVSFAGAATVRKAVRVDADAAVRLFHALVGGLWVSGFFLLLRATGARRLDGVVFTAVASASAASMFWLPATESFAMGSLSMFPALALAARPTGDRPLRQLAASAASFSVTVTNGMAGIGSALSRLRRRRAFVVIAGAAVAAAAVVIIDGLLFPGSRVVPGAPADEAAWVLSPESGGGWAVLRALVFHGMAAPEIRFLENWKHPLWPVMSFQSSGLFSGGGWSRVATIAWAALLAGGSLVVFRDSARPAFRTALIVTLLGQAVLHLFYGRETFLYAMHVTPLLVIVASFSSHSKFRLPALALAAVLAASALAGNVSTLAWARDYAGRRDALKKLEGVSYQPVHGTVPPALGYRFWKEIGR